MRGEGVGELDYSLAPDARFASDPSPSCLCCCTILTIYGTPSLHHKLKMVSKKLVKNRAGFGNHILHGLSNVQA